MIKCLLICLLWHTCTNTLHAQNKASAKATATIISPVGGQILQDLDFGTLPIRGGAIVLGIKVIKNEKEYTPKKRESQPAMAIIDIYHGEDLYAITTPDSCVRISTFSGFDTMEISNIVVAETEPGKVPLSPDRIKIGATLIVSALQSPGRYITNENEDFAVTVHYN